MIELEVNGRRDTVQPVSSADLRAAISRTCPEGHVICTLKINGYEIPESRLDEYDVQAVRSVEVQSADPHDLARDSLDETADWIGRICSALDSVAEDYRTGNERKAAEQLVSAIDALQVLSELLGGIQRFLDADAKTKDLFDGPWCEAQTDLRSALDGLFIDLEAGDPVRLADRIGYVLPRSLQRFRDILDQIRT